MYLDLKEINHMVPRMIRSVRIIYGITADLFRYRYIGMMNSKLYM